MPCTQVDGGYIDNSAILPLLRRGVRSILAIDATRVPLTPNQTAESYAAALVEVARYFGALPEGWVRESRNAQPTAAVINAAHQVGDQGLGFCWVQQPAAAVPDVAHQAHTCSMGPKVYWLVAGCLAG